MVGKLTDKLLQSLSPQDRPLEIRDTEIRGLTYRLQPSGVATFFLQYRDEVGKQGRVKIGRYGDNPHNKEIGIPAARTKAREYLAKITLGANPATEKKAAREAVESLTLRQFIEGPYKDWAESNLKSHKSTLGRLLYGFTSLLDKPLDSLCAFDFEKNRQARLKGKPKSKGEHGPTKGATVNRDQAHMRAALARAVQWGHMSANPLAGVTKTREDKNRSIRAMTDAEETAIIAEFTARRAKRIAERMERAAKGERPGPRVRRYLGFLEPLFILSVESGLRRGEALSLAWSDVDFAKRELTVKGEGAKSSQTRTVPLSKRLETTLTEWKSQTSSIGLIFPRATEDALRGQWIRLLRDAKISGLRWHDLRHTFGTRMALAGASINVLKNIMGHSSITTTQRYLHSTADDARKAIDAMDKTIAANVVLLIREGAAQ